MDVAEVSKFNSISSKWWDLNGVNKALHAINTPRVEFINQYCSSLLGKSVLDIGCGGGILTESLAKQHAIVTGIDPATELIKVATEHSKYCIDYQASELIEFKQNNSNKKFDIITCMELLEHLEEPQSLIMELSSLLNPNGKVFISTINRNFKSYVLGIFAAENVFNVVPKNTHSYDKFIRPSELNNWLTTANLKLEAISGIKYSPFNNQAQLCSSVDINYITYITKIEE